MENLNALQSVECGKVNHDLGKCYNKLKQFDKAQESLTQGYEALKKKYGTHELFVGYIGKDLAEAYLGLGDNDKAIELLTESFVVFKMYLGKKHKTVQKSKEMAKELGREDIIPKYFLKTTLCDKSPFKGLTTHPQ